jgi:hypothetical protein
MRNGLSEVLRSCVMDLASRAWERGGTGRENWTVQLLSLFLMRHADVTRMNLENHAERRSKYMSSTVSSTDPYDLHRLASNCGPVNR